MKKYLLLYTLLAALFTVGCKEEEPNLTPEAAVLVAPINNEACEEGVSISDTQTNITIEWKSALNTEEYVLLLTDLTKNVTITYGGLDITTKTVTVTKGTAYEWKVESRSSATEETATSETRKFYVATEGEENYAPFPAEAIAPKHGQTIAETKVTLLWKTSDVDGDELSYEVFLGESEDGMSSIGTTKESAWPDLSVENKKTYFWKVVTTDAKGNKSKSIAYSFSVQQIKVDFDASSTQVEKGQQVTFTSVVDGTVDTYEWTLVVAAAETGGRQFVSTEKNPTFTLDMIGAYTVKLKVSKSGTSFVATKEKVDFVTVIETSAPATLDDSYLLDGQIALKYSRKMADPSAEVANFNLRVDGAAVNIESVKLKADDASIVLVKPAVAFPYSKTILLSYTLGSMKTGNNVAVAAFTDLQFMHQQKNLFAEGDFESVAIPKNWNIHTWNMKEGATATISSTEGVNGSAAFQGDYTATAGSMLHCYSDGDKSAPGFLKLETGKNYKIELKVKYTGGAPFDVRVHLMPAAPNFKYTEAFKAIVEGKDLKENEWVVVESIITAEGDLISNPEQVVALRVKGNGTAGTVYIDDLAVYEIP